MRRPMMIAVPAMGRAKLGAVMPDVKVNAVKRAFLALNLVRGAVNTWGSAECHAVLYVTDSPAIVAARS